MEGKPAERPHEQDLLGLAADERAHICEEDKPQWPAHAAPQPGDAAGEAAAAAPAASTLSAEELENLTAEIIGALKTVYDPEIPADIYELGLIYKIDIDDSRLVTVDMTLTAPGCPVAGEMPVWVEDAVSAVPGVSGAKVNLTFDPPWSQDRMSDEARLALNMF
jgi:FeS assembly SUF system protein